MKLSGIFLVGSALLLVSSIADAQQSKPYSVKDEHRAERRYSNPGNPEHRQHRSREERREDYKDSKRERHISTHRDRSRGHDYRDYGGQDHRNNHNRDRHLSDRYKHNEYRTEHRVKRKSVRRHHDDFWSGVAVGGLVVHSLESCPDHRNHRWHDYYVSNRYGECFRVTTHHGREVYTEVPRYKCY